MESKFKMQVTLVTIVSRENLVIRFPYAQAWEIQQMTMKKRLRQQIKR